MHSKPCRRPKLPVVPRVCVVIFSEPVEHALVLEVMVIDDVVDHLWLVEQGGGGGQEGRVTRNMYMDIYIYIYVCVCVCAWTERERETKS